MSDHPTELLSVLALDAIATKDERERVERHVAECPRCRQEVDAMRFVAAALGNIVEQPPERVWSGISSRLYERGRRRESVVPVLAPPTSIRRAPSLRRRVLVAIGTVAAVATAFLAVNLAQTSPHAPGGESALGHPTLAVIDAALSTPGHRDVDLRGVHGTDLGEIVLLPSGEGLLVRSDMPPAPAGKTYELWVIEGGAPRPVGLMGATPTAEAFTVAEAAHPSALAVTVEPRAGVPRPTSAPIATASV